MHDPDPAVTFHRHILWTPDNPGVELPTDTAHGEQPVISSAVPGFEMPEMDDVSILSMPIPEEKDFRDYILVFPENAFPPIYVYLSENKTSYAHGYKHYPPKGLSWGEVVKTTKSGPAKFKPTVDIPSIDHEVWENGISTSNGQNWKVMQFDEVKSAYKGKETTWVVTKESQGTIHSHPIGEQEAKRLLK